MKQLKLRDIEGCSVDELKAKLILEKQALLDHRFSIATGRSTDRAGLKTRKRSIAVILTYIQILSKEELRDSFYKFRPSTLSRSNAMDGVLVRRLASGKFEFSVDKAVVRRVVHAEKTETVVSVLLPGYSRSEKTPPDYATQSTFLTRLEADKDSTERGSPEEAFLYVKEAKTGFLLALETVPLPR